jgi:hypothetical protein
MVGRRMAVGVPVGVSVSMEWQALGSLPPAREMPTGARWGAVPTGSVSAQSAGARMLCRHRERRSGCVAPWGLCRGRLGVDSRKPPTGPGLGGEGLW